MEELQAAKDRIKAYNAQYYAANKDRIAAQRKAAREAQKAARNKISKEDNNND